MSTSVVDRLHEEEKESLRKKDDYEKKEKSHREEQKHTSNTYTA